MQSNRNHVMPELYNFLAEAYRCELNEGGLDILKYYLGLIASDVPQVQKELTMLNNCLEQISEDKENGLLALGIEYNNLFRGAGANPVFPFESVLLSEEGLMFESPYFKVKEIYKNLGFNKEGHWNEPEDHIAIECKFIAYLGETMEREHKVGNLEKKNLLMRQRDYFLKEHYYKWVPQFSAKLIKNSSHEFYRHLGSLTSCICPPVS